MSDIAELTVRIKADAAQLSAEMKKVQTTVDQASKGMSSSLGGLKSQLLSLAPAISAVAFVNFAKGAFEAADRLNDLSQRTGVAASTLSALNIPLLQGGSNVEEFSASINRMNNMIGEASKGGSQELYQTFDKLGLSVQKLMQLSPEEQFYAISRALNEIKNQAEFTNTGMNIFGRSFSSLAPLIRGADGNLSGFVDTAKKAGKALSEEDLKRIDDFGDAWTAVVEELKLSFAAFTPVLEKVLLAFQALRDLNPVNIGMKAGTALGNAIRGLPANASYDKPTTLTDEQAAASIQASLAKLNTAKGTNPNVQKLKDEADAAKAAQKSLADYTNELNIHFKTAGYNPEKQAGMEAYYKTLDLAQEAGLENAKDLAKANEAVAESTYKIKEAQQEAIRITDQFHESLSNALTNAIMDFNSASDAAANLAKAIAQMIIQRSIAEPLTTALVGESGTSGGGLLGGVISHLLPSFDVGSPNIPNDMIAQIHKGEMIIPRVQADAIRSGKTSGGGITLVQNNNFSSGVTRAEVASMLPSVAKAAHDAVFVSMQRGGSASKIAGLR